MVILFDQFNLSDDVYQIVFATEQQIDVAKMLIKEFKKFSGEMTKSQMSDFATSLHDGVDITRPVKLGVILQQRTTRMSYNKRQFYDRILTPMKSMGMIDYDLYKKTYKLSEKFTRTINKIAMMWITESKRPSTRAVTV